MVDYSLYIITDCRVVFDNILKIVKLAIQGGTTIVQYRNKNASTEVMIKQAKKLHEITAKYKIPLIINDNIDVALVTNSEGVHVGQEDMKADKARKIIGCKKILGISVKSKKEALEALGSGADYLGVGPIFQTLTKSDAAEPIGIQALKEIVKSVNIPIVGIGGISENNVESVIKTGADGVAVISAIFANSDPLSKTKKLKNIIKNALY